MLDQLRKRVGALVIATIDRVAITCSFGLILCSSLAHSQQSSIRYALSTQQIVAAMQKRQLPVDHVQVELAAPITATVESPQLEIQSVSSSAPHSARLRVACTNHAECLPFFAVASWPEPGRAAERAALVDSKDPSPVQHPSGNMADTVVLPPAVRVGAPATLEIEGDRIHITMQVICLEAGSSGSRIRVMTRDHKRTYSAEVVSRTTLKGTL